MFVVGKNCWQIARADKLKVLIDAADYFAEFARVAARAEHSITIIGWDTDSNCRLFVDRPAGVPVDLPPELGKFLQKLLELKPKLRVRILTWDYALVYALEREWLPFFNFGVRRRLEYVRDHNHPIGASQHQKLVIIDDQIAFSGGLDLCQRRWDTSEHLPHDPRRVDSQGTHYHPFHDVQVMVEGPIVQQLRAIASERWRRRTGKAIPPTVFSPHETPYTISHPDFVNCDIAVSRTDPPHQGRRFVDEVQQLFYDLIDGAKHLIYIENQYLTHLPLAERLGRSLAQPHGPEVVIICPKNGCGWLEEKTMGYLRQKFVDVLYQNNLHDRLKVLHPIVEDTNVNVHSKVMVVDDRYVRIGSANISNRSMGLDTECDLSFEGDGKVIWQRLLAEHCGASVEAVASLYQQSRSVLKILPRLKSPLKRLVEIERVPAQDVVEAQKAIATIADPSVPIAFEDMVDDLVPQSPKRDRRVTTFAKVAGSLLVVALLAYLWNSPGFREAIDIKTLAASLRQFETSPFAFVVVSAIFLVGSFVMVPITVMIVATSIVFDGPYGVLYSFMGSIVAASANYWVGSCLREDFVRRIANGDWYRKRFRKKGVIAVATLRMLPIAPFSIINLTAGAAHVTFSHFIIGTAIGMIPGILAINAVNRQIYQLLRAPSLQAGIVLAVVLVAVFLLARWLGTHLRRDEVATRLN